MYFCMEMVMVLCLVGIVLFIDGVIMDFNDDVFFVCMV